MQARRGAAADPRGEKAMTSRPLPSSRIPPPPPPEAALYPKNTRVRLKSCPSGAPGEVVGHERRRVVVRWPDLEYTGRHRVESLERVETLMEEPAGAQRGAEGRETASQLNGYERMLQKIEESWKQAKEATR